jgi:hypothetical protein
MDKSYSFRGLVFIFAVILCIFTTGPFARATGKDAMEVTRDDEKTTYTVGPLEKNSQGKSEVEKERERAWDMLKHMNIIIDKRGQSDQKNGKQSGE